MSDLCWQTTDKSLFSTVLSFFHSFESFWEFLCYFLKIEKHRTSKVYCIVSRLVQKKNPISYLVSQFILGHLWFTCSPETHRDCVLDTRLGLFSLGNCCIESPNYFCLLPEEEFFVETRTHSVGNWTVGFALSTPPPPPR